GYVVGTPASASGGITDNDTATLTIDATPTVSEEGGAQTLAVKLVITAIGSGNSALGPGVTLTADVVDAGGGTAISGTDYAAFGTQSVSFGPGSGPGDTRTVILTPINDTLVEGNETVKLKLQNLNTTLNGQASLGNTDSVVTIDDNDTAKLRIAFT